MTSNDIAPTVALSENEELTLSNSSHSKTLEGIESGLSLFSPSLTETSVHREVMVDYYPISSLKKRKAVDFHITDSNSLYFDLSRSTLKVKVKIVRSDNSDVDASDKVGFTQLPLHSLWRQCDLLIQNKLVSSGISIHYAYKAILDYLVEYPTEFVEGPGQCALFHYDTPYFIDTVSFAESGSSGVNTGFYKRAQYSKDGSEVVLEGTLAHDLTFTNCYLPGHLDIKLRLWPSEDEFALMSDTSMTENYSYQVTEVTLKMKAIEPTTDLVCKHVSLLSQRNAVFHYNRSEIKTYTIPQNVSTWTLGNLWGGPLPYEALVCFIASDQYLGTRTTSPFNFHHFNLEYLNLSLERYQDITYTPQFGDSESKNWVSEYLALYEQDSGKRVHNGIIKYADFAGGYAIFRLKLSASHIIRKNRIQNGVGRLTCRWKVPLPKSVTVLVYSKYHNKLQLDKTGNIWITDC